MFMVSPVGTPQHICLLFILSLPAAQVYLHIDAQQTPVKLT